jgi:hypothetical protein
MPPPGCPDADGFIQPEMTFRLKFYDGTISQEDAQYVCENALNGRLAVIDAEWKLKTISNMLMSCSGNSYEHGRNLKPYLISKIDL